MAIICKYKFNSSINNNYLPVFNIGFTGYTISDADNGDGTITRTIEHDSLLPTTMRFGNDTDPYVEGDELALLEILEMNTSSLISCGNMFKYCQNLTSINCNWDTSKVTSMRSMFNNCKSLASLDVSNFDTSNVNDVNAMFYNCKSLTSLDVSNFDTSKVTSMNAMFFYCSSLTTLDVSNFDTSDVTDMKYMFNNCTKLTSLDVSNFDTSKVTNMQSMFNGCQSLTSLDVSNFDTSNVTMMQSMFNSCTKLTSLDVSNFVTSDVTMMNDMFNGCQSLTSLDVSNFDTSNVTNMKYMFNNCTKLTSLDVSNFDTSKVANMSYMFYNCQSLTSLDLSNFDTSKVTNMSYMFYNCQSLTSLDVSNFVTSDVTDMSIMFDQCINLPSLDVSNFDTSKVTSMNNMFRGCKSLTILDVSNFDTSKVTNMNNMFQNCTSLTDIALRYSNETTINTIASACSGLPRNIWVMDIRAEYLPEISDITWKQYEEFVKELYYYDSDNNNILTPVPCLHEWDSIKRHADRKWYYHRGSAKRVYNNGDENNPNVITDMVNSVYRIANERVYEVVDLTLNCMQGDMSVIVETDKVKTNISFKVSTYVGNAIISNRDRIGQLELTFNKYVVKQDKMTLQIRYMADQLNINMSNANTYSMSALSLPNEIDFTEHVDYELYNLIKNNILVGAYNYDKNFMEELIYFYNMNCKLNDEMKDELLLEIEKQYPIIEYPEIEEPEEEPEEEGTLGDIGINIENIKNKGDEK